MRATHNLSGGLRIVALAGAALLTTATGAWATDVPRWTLDWSGDRAGVSLGASRSTWWSGRAQITYRREAKGGAFFAVQSLRRFGATDTTFIAGGWRHVGPWSVYAEAGGTRQADFFYRRSAEIEVFRQVTGTWVAHASYRFFAFPAQDVHLISPSVTRYGARSEMHARLIIGRNTTRHDGSLAVLTRGHLDVRPRLRLGGGLAVGERIFDVTSLPGDPARGWVAFAEVRVMVGKSDSIGVLARRAAESSTFRQTAFGLAYRKTF